MAKLDGLVFLGGGDGGPYLSMVPFSFYSLYSSHPMVLHKQINYLHKQINYLFTK